MKDNSGIETQNSLFTINSHSIFKFTQSIQSNYAAYIFQKSRIHILQKYLKYVMNVFYQNFYIDQMIR